MSYYQDSTNKRRHSRHRRSSNSASLRATKSPSALRASTTRRLAPTPEVKSSTSINLFTSLLLNREGVYQSRPAPFTARSATDTHLHGFQEEQSQNMFFFDRLKKNHQMGPTTRSRTGELSESKHSLGDKTLKKRSSPSVAHRVSKMKKSRANCGKKVNTSTSNRARAEQPITIESSDEEKQDSDDDRPLMLRIHNTKKYATIVGSADRSSLDLSKQEEEEDFDMVESSQSKLDVVEARAETDKVRKEMDDRIMSMQKEMDDMVCNMRKEKDDMISKMQKEIVDKANSMKQERAERAELQRQLDSERSKAIAADQERDELLATHMAKYNKLAQDIKAQKQEIEAQKCLYNKRQEDHENILNNIVQTKASQYSQLEQQNALLMTEIKNLKDTSTQQTTPPSTQRSTISPACSLFNAGEETRKQEEARKTENVRKAYTRVKRRFDNLQSIAVDISTCTRLMDLSSFGDFGRYVRQMRAVLEDDANEQTEGRVGQGRYGKDIEDDCK